MNHRYAIEQLVTSARFRYQIGFARITLHLAPQFADATLAASWEGLRILATSECGLERPREMIRRMHDGDVTVQPPQVRLIPGEPAREPVMSVEARIPADCVDPVVHDLLARGAHIENARRDGAIARVAATAPLRNLLGYRRSLAALAGEGSEMRMALSHYAPLHASRSPVAPP